MERSQSRVEILTGSNPARDTGGGTGRPCSTKGEDLMRKSSVNLSAMFVGLLLAFFVLVAVVACNNDDSTAYYPHDTTHGYYDSHHHYHYYPKYGNGRVPTLKPGPKVQAPKGGYKSCCKSGSSRRR